VLRIPRESVAGQPLGLGRTLPLERLHAKPENIVGRGRAVAVS